MVTMDLNWLRAHKAVLQLLMLLVTGKEILVQVGMLLVQPMVRKTKHLLENQMLNKGTQIGTTREEQVRVTQNGLYILKTLGHIWVVIQQTNNTLI